MDRLRRNGITLVLVMVLAALPLAGAMCAAICARAAGSDAADLTDSGAHHHHSGGTSSSPETLSQGQLQMTGVPGRDCPGDHGTAGSAIGALTASRIDATLFHLHNARVPLTPALFLATSTSERSVCTPPSGFTRPAGAPLPLRI